MENHSAQEVEHYFRICNIDTFNMSEGEVIDAVHEAGGVGGGGGDFCLYRNLREMMYGYWMMDTLV